MAPLEKQMYNSPMIGIKRTEGVLLRATPFFTPVVIVGFVALALFASSPLPAVPMIAFLWLLVVKEKGYFLYGAIVFIATGLLFLLEPVFWSGFLMVASMVALSCVPARRKDMGRWHIASRDGAIHSWFFPKNSREDIGAIVGDASIHIIALAAILVAYATWIA